MEKALHLPPQENLHPGAAEEQASRLLYDKTALPSSKLGRSPGDQAAQRNTMTEAISLYSYDLTDRNPTSWQ